VANLLLQKAPSNEFSAVIKLRFAPSPKYYGERTGLVVMGRNYGLLSLENTKEGLVLSQNECMDADKRKLEKVNASVTLKNYTVYLKVKLNKDAQCEFSYSTDGKKFNAFGKGMQAHEGHWIGTKVGTFCTRPAISTNDGGWAEVDWFRIEK